MNISVGIIRSVAMAGVFFVASTGVAVSDAHAMEKCETARSVAGPFPTESRAFSKAVARLPTAVRKTEQRIRRSLRANGFNPGAARYGRFTDRCYRRGLGTKCEAYQRVCVRYQPVRRCKNPKQYYSASARRCVTLH